MDYDYDSFSDYSYDYDYGSTYDGSDLAALGGTGLAVGGVAMVIGAIVGLLVFAFNLYLVYRFLTKMGYSGWLTLLNFVPLATLIMWIYFAFAEWPVEKRAKQMSGGQQ